MRSRAVVAIVVLAGAGLFAGCAQPGYNANAIERQLQDAGATPEQATCVLRALENKYDPNQLASRSDPTARELATTRAILVRCGIKNLRPQP